MAVLTISKEYACDLERFTKMLVERLGYRLLNKQMLAEMAEELGIPEQLSLQFQKEQESRFLRFIDKYTAMQRALDRSYGRIDNKAYLDVIARLVARAAQSDNLIITGWGGQCILQNHVRALHLRVVKDLKERVAWLKEKFGLDENLAQELIEREDAGSAAYIKHGFNRFWDDAHLYHLVLNFSKISLQTAVLLIVDLVEQHSMAKTT